MDTDLIFKRGVAYTLATGLILGATSGPSRWLRSWCTTRASSGPRVAFPIAMMVALAVFDPSSGAFSAG